MTLRSLTYAYVYSIIHSVNYKLTPLSIDKHCVVLTYSEVVTQRCEFESWLDVL